MALQVWLPGEQPSSKGLVKMLFTTSPNTYRNGYFTLQIENALLEQPNRVVLPPFFTRLRQ